MTVEPVGNSDRLDDEWMIVAVSEANGALRSWRWNVKRRRHNHWEIVATSERACLSRADAMQAAEAFLSAELTWDRSNPENDS